GAFPFQEACRRPDRRKFVGRQTQQTVNGAEANAPTLWSLARVCLLHLRKHAFNRISQPLGRASAQRPIAVACPNVLKADRLGRALHVERNTQHRFSFFVAQAAPPERTRPETGRAERPKGKRCPWEIQLSSDLLVILPPAQSAGRRSEILGSRCR